MCLRIINRDWCLCVFWELWELWGSFSLGRILTLILCLRGITLPRIRQTIRVLFFFLLCNLRGPVTVTHFYRDQSTQQAGRSPFPSPWSEVISVTMPSKSYSSMSCRWSMSVNGCKKRCSQISQIPPGLHRKSELHRRPAGFDSLHYDYFTDAIIILLYIVSYFLHSIVCNFLYITLRLQGQNWAHNLFAEGRQHYPPILYYIILYSIAEHFKHPYRYLPLCKSL